MAPKCNLCSCLRKVRIISDTFAAIMARYTGVDGGKVVAVKSEDRQIEVKKSRVVITLESSIKRQLIIKQKEKTSSLTSQLTVKFPSTLFSLISQTC